MHILLTLLGLIVLPSSVWAAAETLYVRPTATCSNNGDGTAYACAGSPGGVGAFKGFTNVLTSSTDETAGRVDPGDTLYICGAHTGQQFTYGPTDGTSPGSGTLTNKVTISWNCPSDTGSIDATGVSSGFLTEQSYLNIINPVISNGTGTGLNMGAHSSDYTIDRYITVTGGTVTGTGQMCVSMGGRYSSFTNMTISECGWDGFYIEGKGTTITGNTITHVSTVGVAGAGDCVQLTNESDGSLIDGNTCDHRNFDDKYCFFANATVDHGFVIMRNNTCYAYVNGASNIGMSSFDPVLMYSNYIEGGVTGMNCSGASGYRCDILGNVIVNSTTGGLFGSNIDTLLFANNTVSGGTLGIQVNKNNAGNRLYSNIFSGQTTGINKFAAGNAPLDQYNLFYNISGNNLVVNGTPTAPGTGSLLATNPLFMGASDYRLQPSSPARRAGLAGQLCRDRRHPDMMCWAPPDIGAYQMHGGARDPANVRVAR